MKNSLISLFVLLVVPIQVFAVLSPLRKQGEQFTEAHLRAKLQTIGTWSSETTASGWNSPWDQAKPLDQLDLSKATSLESAEQLTTDFEYLRDTKFFEAPQSPIKNRRISWLYPDDGCYTRAMMMAHYFNKKENMDAKKIFAFGNLRARTSYSHDGYVRWWYHVAISLKVNDILYVYDPSVNNTKPLTIQEWQTAISDSDEEVKFAICEPNTFGPEDDCDNPKKYPIESHIKSQLRFLELEWERIDDLGLNPHEILGDNPPWKNQ